MRFAIPIVLLAAVACGGAGTSNAKGSPSEGEDVQERVVYEKQPDGSIKKTTIRTTRKTVPAAPPPARPADPYPSDPLVRYNVERIAAYRAQKGLPALLYDAKISAFALRGSEQLSQDHSPHAHFAAKAKGAPMFGSRAAENQGDPSGVPALDPDPAKNGRKQVDIMLKLMMDEGPGGGHYDNMMNTHYRRVGIGIFYANGRMYLTNDFSD
jgi:uncharacterized protein YkwD